MSAAAPRVACSGSLLSRSSIELIATSSAGKVDASRARAFRAIVRDARNALRGGGRAVVDTCAEPLAQLLGFDTGSWRGVAGASWIGTLVCERTAVGMLIALPFQEPLVAARTAAISAAAGERFRWALLTNGTELMLLDCARPYARRWLLFDLAGCAADLQSLGALLAIGGARSLAAGSDGQVPLEAMIARSDAELAIVRAALQAGVERAALTLTAALDRGRGRAATPVGELFEQALTVVYRILFLQFAEARGLVPTWHPTYRRAYTIAALRESLADRQEARGLWDALQAIARLAHAGAKAGELKVVAFNGRLFSPAHAPAVCRGSVSDRAAAEIVTALTCRAAQQGHRVAFPFVDLGVEQLGSIYERVLDFTPTRGEDGRARLCPGTNRKGSGSFYTPRALTEFLVRRALEPLTRNATPEQVLALRVLDPAMGSGAFLVAACRYLAHAYEEALVRYGRGGDGDFSSAERAGFRRLVAQHCLFGVDLNPMAVQLGRLSLWLCSLAADRPLTFLDHRLRVGNSVIGTALETVSLRAPGGRSRARPTLFHEDALEAVGRAREIRRAIAAIPDDSLRQVREKERMLAALDSRAGPLAAWRAICDLWCAWWFWPEGDPPSAREFGALCDRIKGGEAPWSAALGDRLEAAARVARGRSFFHWQLEFPEVLLQGGFDAVVGNPPWDMIRGDAPARQMLRFTRESGIYRLQSSGHGNLYQLFLERALQLVRPGGRLALILPWSLATDEGSAALRRHLMDRCSVEDLLVMDNAERIFPVHRSLKFCVLSLEAGGRTDTLSCRPPARDVTALESPYPGRESPASIELPRALVTAVSGPSLAIPLLSRPAEVRALERIIAAAPAASDPEGWALAFSRELNASDDRALFTEGGAGYPVISGRHISPFIVRAEQSPLRIAPRAARARLGGAIDRHRLAYRDVAGAANRVTLISAIVPPRVVTTHTLFCLQTRAELDEQWFVCAILNSLVANFVVRTRVGTHVTTALVHGLPIPKPHRDSAVFRRIVALAQEGGRQPVLQGMIAALYQLDCEMWSAVLETFPLIPADERAAAHSALGPVSRGGAI